MICDVFGITTESCKQNIHNMDFISRKGSEFSFKLLD